MHTIWSPTIFSGAQPSKQIVTNSIKQQSAVGSYKPYLVYDSSNTSQALMLMKALTFTRCILLSSYGWKQLQEPHSTSVWLWSLTTGIFCDHISWLQKPTSTVALVKTSCSKPQLISNGTDSLLNWKLNSIPFQEIPMVMPIWT